jgi:hypothetical protein
MHPPGRRSLRAESFRTLLDLCPELVRTLRRELSQMDARIGALQRSRGALAAYLR